MSPVKTQSTHSAAPEAPAFAGAALRGILAACLLLLSACATGGGDYESYMNGRRLKLPQGLTVTHCHGYGCIHTPSVTLTEKEWAKVEKLFRPRAKNAAAERKQVARAVGLMEKIVGAKAGTDGDIAGTFRQTGVFQLDCVDESTNTTSTLALLKQKGLLRFHDVRAPTARFPVIHAGNWPHQTGVIVETRTGTRYAVDSWFRDNGQPADIVGMDSWMRGWKPENVEGSL